MINQLRNRGKKEEKLDSPQSFFKELETEFLVHELKDPLSVIETGVRTLLERQEKMGALSGRQEKTLKRVLRNTQKARSMLYGLLEIGRSETGAFDCESFYPAKAIFDLLADILESFPLEISDELRGCQGKTEALALLTQHGIDMDIAPQIAEIEMVQDQIKFRQIIGNLLKNALHHCRERIQIAMKTNGADLIVEISDDGPGVDPEHHQLIFKRYAQANECVGIQRKGHGLGLAGGLVVARCLGGDIELESKRGKGATFRLIIPLKLETISPKLEKYLSNNVQSRRS